MIINIKGSEQQQVVYETAVIVLESNSGCTEQGGDEYSSHPLSAISVTLISHDLKILHGKFQNALLITFNLYIIQIA